MLRSKAVERLLGLVAVVLLSAGIGSAGHLAQAGPPPTGRPVAPELALVCEMDLCTAAVTYVLPTRDDHDVTFLWQSLPAPGYADNRADTLVRVWPAGIGEGITDGGGYRYAASDLVWHSDIRCDAEVTVTVVTGKAAPRSLTVAKQVPDDRVHAYCSGDGMHGDDPLPHAGD